MISTLAHGEVFRNPVNDDQVLCELTLAEWHAFADSHPDKTVFHHQNWIRLLIDTYGFKLHIPAVKQNGHILAAVPFVETRSLRGARKLISLPFTDCMSVLAESDDAVSMLREGLTTEQCRPYSLVVLRTEQPFQRDGSAQWSRHVINTSRPLDEITAQFSRTLRANLRRAENRSLTFQFNKDASAFQEFYRLFLRTRRKHGVPVQPKGFFRGLYERILLQDLGCVGLARDGDTAIAAGVFLSYGGKMTCKYLASDANALDRRPNEFLLLHAIRTAVETGHTTFDFGISRREQVGLRRFKGKFGGTENDVYNDCLAGNGQPLLEHSRAMRIVSATIKKSPPFICRAVGALFYRYSQ